MALKKGKTEAGHKAGRTGRKSLHRDERKDAARVARRREDKASAEARC
jgi:hypothetical protein